MHRYKLPQMHVHLYVANSSKITEKSLYILSPGLVTTYSDRELFKLQTGDFKKDPKASSSVESRAAIFLMSYDWIITK